MLGLTTKIRSGHTKVKMMLTWCLQKCSGKVIHQMIGSYWLKRQRLTPLPNPWDEQRKYHGFASNGKSWTGKDVWYALWYAEIKKARKGFIHRD